MKTLFALPVVTAALFLTPQGGHKKAEFEDLIKVLRSTDALARQEAQRQLVSMRGNLVRELIRTIDQDENPLEFFSSTTLSMELLGDFRAVESIEALSQRITHKPALVLDEIREPEAEYPAVAALVKIGYPAIPSMISILANNEDEEVVRLCVWVIRKITDDEVTKFILQRELQKGNSPDVRERLQQAIKRLK